MRKSLGDRELFLRYELVVEHRIVLVCGFRSELDVRICESDEALQLRRVIARTRARCARWRTIRGIIARVPVVVPVAVVVALAAPLLIPRLLLPVLLLLLRNDPPLLGPARGWLDLLGLARCRLF